MQELNLATGDISETSWQLITQAVACAGGTGGGGGGQGEKGDTGDTGWTGWTGWTGPAGTGYTGWTGWTGWTGVGIKSITSAEPSGDDFTETQVTVTLTDNTSLTPFTVYAKNGSDSGGGSGSALGPNGWTLGSNYVSVNAESAVNVPTKTLVAGDGIEIETEDNTVTISSTGTGTSGYSGTRNIVAEVRYDLYSQQLQVRYSHETWSLGVMTECTEDTEWTMITGGQAIPETT